MIKGNWHFIACSVLFSVFALKTNHLLLWMGLLIGWLLYLYALKRISLIIFLLTLGSFAFFYSYLPSYEKGLIEEKGTLQKQISLKGTIASSVKQTNKSVSFTFRLQETNERIIVTHFYSPSASNHPLIPFPHTYKAYCTITGKLEEPNSATNPFEFNYKQYLFEQGIKNQLMINSLDDIQCKESKAFLSQLYSLRDQLIFTSNQQLNPQIAAWQQALLFGNSDNLPDEVQFLFQRWGLSHLLAISGLHVGIIIAIIYFILLRVLQVTREKAIMVVVLFLPVYAILAGGEPSVWRATLMTIFVFLLTTKQIPMGRLDILSMVFLFLIFNNKYIIYHIGFQFSFLVTFALILSVKWFSRANSKLESLLQISFIAQMMIVPLQMYYFYHFQPLSILLNVLVVPYFSLFVIPAMFFSFIIYIVPTPVGHLFESIFLLIHEFVIQGIFLIDKYLNYPFISGEISLLIAFVYYIFLFLMMIFLEKNRLKSAFYSGVGICLVLTFIIMQPYLSKTGVITMLDIGQGDAYIIELPYREAVFLIDAGATFDFESFEPNDTVYRRIIEPYLMGRGIGTIDTIFISHPHLDHHGSVRYILEGFNVKEIIIDPYFEMDDSEMKEWLRYENLTITRANLSEEIVRKGHSFYVLAPLKDRRDKNDNSLVLYTRIGGANWLFTGDISQSVEEEIVGSFPNLQVDMLKVAHHGSKTSTSERIVEELNPKAAFIPVGRSNRYGHPANEVIERLEENGLVIYRTDEDGAVQYKFRDNKSTITTFTEK